MSNFGQELLEQIQKVFGKKMARDPELLRLADKIRDGTYEDAGNYAARLGELLGQSIDESTKTLTYMSREVASKVVDPMLRQDHDLLIEIIRIVQQRMNEEAGLGLNPVLPEVDESRISGIIDRIAEAEHLDDIRWIFGEPVTNYSQSVIDDAVRLNARATSKLGLTAYIVREAEPAQMVTAVRHIGLKSYKVRYQVPCKWCKKLAGRYKYEDAPKDVYRRHEGCRCKVTYEYGGRRQDVFSKREWSAKEKSEATSRIKKATKQKQQEQAQQTEQIQEGLTEMQRAMKQWQAEIAARLKELNR